MKHGRLLVCRPSLSRPSCALLDVWQRPPCPPTSSPRSGPVIQSLNYVIMTGVVDDGLCDLIRSYFSNPGAKTIRNHTDDTKGREQRTQKNFIFGGDKGKKRVDKRALLDSVRQLAWHP
jgi:hypothetical protein